MTRPSRLALLSLLAAACTAPSSGNDEATDGDRPASCGNGVLDDTDEPGVFSGSTVFQRVVQPLQGGESIYEVKVSWSLRRTEQSE